ncbi:uncharacterized protein IL334_003712 [Kwoniella shivajii]|uniref:DUF159-domain-containing protein n=1 Tax=Kwoniella shivajii TaxID=564305 RepID=A0ABZ1CZJ6_9TREE|nr:hypothetical protein IL334_003712 [Kwoniella shivajii]
MCGRYALALSNEELYDSLEARLPRLFQNGRPRWERPQDNRGGNYNIAPRSRAPVIRRDPTSPNEAMIETMQWGLVPHWTKHPPTGPLNTINARSEGLLDASSGGMWHALKAHKRCIIPAQGYYEWMKKSSSKIAHFTRLPIDESKGETVENPGILFFAGLFDIVNYVEPVQSKYQLQHQHHHQDGLEDDTEKDQEKNRDKFDGYPTGNPIPLSTYTILTTEPSRDLRWLHDRMPVILSSPEDIYRWLDLGELGSKSDLGSGSHLDTQQGWKEGKGGTGDLLTSKEGLESYPVPSEVGKIGNNSPTFIQPVSERKDGIKSFFQKQFASPAKSAGAGAGAGVGVKKEIPLSSTSPSTSTVISAKVEKVPPSKFERKTRSNTKDVRREAEGIKSEISNQDEEKGLGDDSNAPNVSENKRSVNVEEHVIKEVESDDRVDEDEIQEIKPDTKRKREADDGDQQELETDRPKKSGGGHQTKVTRRATDAGDKEQPAITNFFKSPSASDTKNSSKPVSAKKKRR